MDAKKVTQRSLICTVMTSISWEYTGTSDYCDGSTIANSALNFCFQAQGSSSMPLTSFDKNHLYKWKFKRTLVDLQ